MFYLRIRTLRTKLLHVRRSVLGTLRGLLLMHHSDRHFLLGLESLLDLVNNYQNLRLQWRREKGLEPLNVAIVL